MGVEFARRNNNQQRNAFSFAGRRGIVGIINTITQTKSAQMCHQTERSRENNTNTIACSINVNARPIQMH